MQLAEQAHKLRVQAGDAGLEGRLLTGGFHLLLDLLAAALHALLDAPGVDAAVGDELLEGHAGDLAAHGVEAGEHDGLGRVVHDEVNAGGLLEGADVAALAADDAALHVVARQRDHGDGALRGVVYRAALDGKRDDLVGLAVGFLLRLRYGLADELVRVLGDVLLDLREERVTGLLARQA